MPPFVRCPKCDRRFRRPPAEDTENCCPFCDAALDADETEWDEEVRSSNTNTIVIFSLVGVGVMGLLCAGVLGFAVWRLRSFSSLPERPVGAPPDFNPRVGEPFALPAPLQQQTEDYAQARRLFQTKLIRQGPAPQQGQIEQPPAGVREVTYQSGNLRLRAWVNGSPPDARKRPAILFLHGGFAFGADDWEQTQPFRDAGFVVMTPTLRGENGLPGSYSMFYNEVEDVLAAAETLAKLSYVDSNRLYVSGHSVGGTLTMLAAMTSNRFRAAASFSGSPDQASWASGQPQVVPFNPADQREFQMRSPLAFPQSFKCPVRIYYGNREFFFAANSQQTAKRAKTAGLDVEAVSVPGDHLSMVEPAMKQAIAFFQQK
jgi:dienelactone hydrolase